MVLTETQARTEMHDANRDLSKRSLIKRQKISPQRQSVQTMFKLTDKHSKNRHPQTQTVHAMRN